MAQQARYLKRWLWRREINNWLYRWFGRPYSLAAPRWLVEFFLRDAAAKGNRETVVLLQNRLYEMAETGADRSFFLSDYPQAVEDRYLGISN